MNILKSDYLFCPKCYTFFLKDSKKIESYSKQIQDRTFTLYHCKECDITLLYLHDIELQMAKQAWKRTNPQIRMELIRIFGRTKLGTNWVADFDKVS